MKPSTMISEIDKAIDSLNKIQRAGDIGMDLDFNIDALRRDLVRNRIIQERRLGTGNLFFSKLRTSLNCEVFFCL